MGARRVKALEQIRVWRVELHWKKLSRNAEKEKTTEHTAQHSSAEPSAPVANKPMEWFEERNGDAATAPTTRKRSDENLSRARLLNWWRC